MRLPSGSVTDFKTLRLASLQLSADRLERFIVYQRTLLTELSQASSPDWNGRYAFAHGRALLASALDVVDLGKLKAMVADFCGRRSALEVVQERLIQAKTGESLKDAQIVARAHKQLPLLQNFSSFVARHGEDALALLRAREAELLELHRELARQEGTGHLHAARN